MEEKKKLNITVQVVLLWKNDQLQGFVMWLDMKQGYSYHAKADYFTITTNPDVCFLSRDFTTADELFFF